MIHLGCWAHARRYFVEAEAVIPKSARGADQPAAQFIAAIGQLYAIEAQAKTLASLQRGQLRNEQSRPVLMKIEAMLLQHLHAVTPNSLLGKALHYLSSQWPKLTRFVDNGDWPIDNNPCEYTYLVDLFKKLPLAKNAEDFEELLPWKLTPPSN